MATKSMNPNDYKPQPMGNYAMRGLNLLGCDSTILWEGQIWHFYAFTTGSIDGNVDARYIIYVGASGERIFSQREVQSSTCMELK